MRPHALAAFAVLALLAPGATRAPAQETMRFRGMDTNRDGKIDRREWRGSDQSFQVHDWNGDGELSGEEVRVGGQRRRADDDFDVSRRGEFSDWTPEGFANHDHNRDGRIARDEWHYDLESFRRADRNRDGTLTRTEFLDIDTDSDREDRFDYLDSNRNGAVERAEWHGSRDAFEWLDRNNDGRLSRTEVVGESAETSELFANLDANRDNRLSMDEWHWSRRSFNQRDTNRDGVLSRQELSSADVDSAPVGTSGRRRGQVVIVESTQRWVDTGIDVERGDRIALTAEGRIQLSTNVNDTATPEGSITGRRAGNAPLGDRSAGALIARIGSSAPMFVGTSDTIDSPARGRLYLSVNDDHLNDNSGQFRVMVSMDR